MSLSTLKRKVDVENHSFKDDWKEKYVCILPSFVNAKPLCLLCNEKYNLRRHFESRHKTFNESFPLQSDARRQKIDSLVASYIHSNKILVSYTTQQQKATAASLKVAWILTRKNKPFTDAETFKECMVAALEEVVPHEKIKASILTTVKQIPLSARTTTRRVHVLAEEVQHLVLDGLTLAEYISVALDESTDKTDVAQLCVYVRYFDGTNFREELLGLIPLENYTTGDIIFERLNALFKKHRLSLENICLVVTDGAPSMVGRHKGLIARLSAVAPQLKALHCLIHQSVLCARLSGELKEVMETIMKVINFIRATSSLQHRLFRELVAESSANYEDLLLHNDVRWLSRGKSLERFCGFQNQACDFLQRSCHKKVAEYRILLENKEFIAKVAFLTDIFCHFNALNLQLQGRNKTIIDLVEKLNAFGKKLDIFLSDLTSHRLLHFNWLRKHQEEAGTNDVVTDLMTDLIDQMKDNFSARFDKFSIPRDVIGFVRDPFSVKPDGDFSSHVKKVLPAIDEAALQLELVDFQGSSLVKTEFTTANLESFWTAYIHAENYANMKKLALFVLCMFGSTYTCKASFSTMNAIKTDARNRLT
ncbi:SCAN domain-containing protein 3-like [Huso huso]|uniref:SCAN domain-containing protein 3-like n=1 Tax=Huso huso TaxID=61971 RepID=A0ABR1A5G2_HUSHU